MLIHSKRSNLSLNLYINNHKIKQVNSFEYLGIFIDDKLKWDKQIKSTESRLSQACGAMARIRPFVDTDCLRTLYYGHAYTYLQYAILAWGSATKTKLKRIQVLQNRVLRLLALHGPLSDIELNNNEIYANLQLLKFPDIYHLETAKFMHRCVNGNLPKSYYSYFGKTRLGLRSTQVNPFRTNSARTDAYKRTLVNNGISVWTELDMELKKLPYPIFKGKLKQDILSSYV